MTETKQPEFYSEENTVYSLKHGGYEHGEEYFVNSTTIQISGDDKDGYTKLVLNAINHHNSLVAALENCIKELSCYIDNSESIKVYNDAKAVLENATK